ncbi:hypothetical protein T11_902 [Trichinella zimbabwensis]|uniref:Uncharacterized protein n=1 Tax=Trichinella zimbabwensis TaxID=268475 RepID=A0A0V1GA74_9BILA|nr:hypothetical protein T11_902 [Trichinella zimbabwensis]
MEKFFSAKTLYELISQPRMDSECSHITFLP